MKTSTSSEFHDEHDDSNTRNDTALWRKYPISRLATSPPAGQSWCYMCVTSVLVVVLLALIITVSVTKEKTMMKFSSVEGGINNMSQSLLSITSRIQELEKHSVDANRKMRSTKLDLDRAGSYIADLASPIQTLNDVLIQLQCNLNKLSSNNTQQGCCPLEWTLFSSHCYYFSDNGKAWNDARDECENMNAQLLVLKSEEEKEFVIRKTKPNFYWLGLSDERTGEWEWLDGTPYQMTRSDWLPGQPDDWKAHGLGGGEDCAHFHRDGRYNDDHCSRNYRFVCKTHSSNI